MYAKTAILHEKVNNPNITMTQMKNTIINKYKL